MAFYGDNHETKEGVLLNQSPSFIIGNNTTALFDIPIQLHRNDEDQQTFCYLGVKDSNSMYS